MFSSNIQLVISITAALSSPPLKFVIPNGRLARRNLLFCKGPDERQTLLRLYPSKQKPDPLRHVPGPALLEELRHVWRRSGSSGKVWHAKRFHRQPQRALVLI